jgi:hypothetical protein
MLSGIKISSTFRRRTAIPLDLWYVQDTLNDRDVIPSTVRYEGMPVYVKATSVCYKLIGGITNQHWVRCDKDIIKYNLQADNDPTQSNNQSEDYTEGSLWINKNTEDVFILSNFVGSNANWISIGKSEMTWYEVIW